MTTENPEGQEIEGQESVTPEPAQSAPRDYSKDFEELKSLYTKQEQKNEALNRDIQSHKETLAKEREEYRRRSLLALGDTESVKEEEEKRRQSQIKNELYKVVPEFKDFVESKGNPQQPAGQPSVGEMHFFNSARTQAGTLAEENGFKTDAGKQIMTTLGDYLININPTWKQRFYGQGDTSVLKEVNDWFNKEVLGPRDEAIKAKLIDQIKRQGRYAAPVPQKGGGSSQPKAQPKLNVNNPNERSQMLQNLAERVIQSAE